jgi:DNA-binding response OmpR family regulator
MNERKKVLIIDEEVDLCLLMKTYFLRKNYEVFIAHTFDDGLTKAKECQPDIIFLSPDVCPDLEENIRELREAAPGADIRIMGSQKKEN